jgi:glycosyltransferase involved in cell wall biosynthesis
LPNVHQILFTNDHTSFQRSLELERVWLRGDETFQLWGLSDARNFLEEHFESEVSDAFDNLKPFAFKADLFRYCVTWKLGGWYFDYSLDIPSVRPVTERLDLVLFRDLNNVSNMSPHQLANGVFFSKESTPLMKYAFEKVVENSEKGRAGHSPLDVSGPRLLGLVAAMCYDKGELGNFAVGDYVFDENLIRNKFSLAGRTVALGKLSAGGELDVPGTNNYVELWNSGGIFNGGGGHEPAISVGTDNPVTGVNHFGYAAAYHNIVKSFSLAEVDGKKLAVRGDDASIPVRLFMGSNPGAFFPGQYKIQMTQWESTLAPASWRDFAKNYDEFWTANHFGAGALTAAGIPEQKVHVFEHGVDANVWTKERRGQNGKVRFLHVDSDNPRKRSDLALLAFKNEFGEDPNFELTLKYSLRKTLYYDAFPTSTVDWSDPKVMEKHGNWEGNVRRIEEIISEQDLVRLFHHHDILVYPSEGEGFGLIPLQALATGMPTICTGRWPSYERFLRGNVIDSDLAPSTVMHHYPGFCAIPSVESLQALMRKVASNLENQSSDFFDQAAKVAEDYDWQVLSQNMIDGLLSRIGKGKFETRISGSRFFHLFSQSNAKPLHKLPRFIYSARWRAALRNLYFLLYRGVPSQRLRTRFEAVAQSYFMREP